jgi:hypothetical protein
VNPKCGLNKLDKMERQIESERQEITFRRRHNEPMVKQSRGSWPSGRGSYALTGTTGRPNTNRSWHQSWRRRGQLRRIGSAERPFNTPEHRPLHALARTELPQLIWGTTCKGVSAILRAWGIRYLATTSPCELQNNTNPNSHNRYASKSLSTVSAQHHLLGNQPAQAKLNVSYNVSISSKMKRNTLREKLALVIGIDCLW